MKRPEGLPKEEQTVSFFFKSVELLHYIPGSGKAAVNDDHFALRQLRHKADHLYPIRWSNGTKFFHLQLQGQLSITKHLGIDFIRH